jgi:hypothetical protein
VSEITAVAQTEAGPGRDASDGRLWKSLGYDFFALGDEMRASVSKPPRLPYVGTTHMKEAWPLGPPCSSSAAECRAERLRERQRRE